MSNLEYHSGIAVESSYLPVKALKIKNAIQGIYEHLRAMYKFLHIKNPSICHSERSEESFNILRLRSGWQGVLTAEKIF